MLAAVMLLAGAACSGSGGSDVPPTAQFGGPDVSAVIVTTDHAVGQNRLVFGLVDRDGMPVRAGEARFQAEYVPPDGETAETRGEEVAKFRRWPTGMQGVFVAWLTLDQPGFWRLNVSAVTPEGREVTAEGAFQVKSQADTPAVGHPAPRSVTPTIDSAGGVESLHTITTAKPPDPDLYRISMDEALETGKPLVVAFSTPGFCVTATCGPQLQALSQVKDKFRGQANFIHVEVFKDPHLIHGTRPTGHTAPAVSEWNLPTEPWTFVVDGDGLVQAKFEQYAGADEIEAALAEVLAKG